MQVFNRFNVDDIIFAVLISMRSLSLQHVTVFTHANFKHLKKHRVTSGIPFMPI